MPRLRKTVSLSNNKRLDITIFRKKGYFHLHDYTKRKNVSLNRDEFDTLASKAEKIKKIADRLQEKSLKGSKKGKGSSKRVKKRNKKHNKYSSSEDMTDDNEDSSAGSNDSGADETESN